jgi:dihydrofolate reductase
MNITLIAAFDNERAIAKNGEIPWDFPREQAHFRETTMGHPLIVGRETFENMGNLRGRDLIVLSKSAIYPDVINARSIPSALSACKEFDTDEVFVAGGESVYEQFIERADEMILTKIDGRYDGDQFFPDFSLDNWELQSQRINNNYSVLEYERR